MCAFQKQSIVPHVSFAPAQCVNFSHILKLYLSRGVHCLSFFTYMLVMFSDDHHVFFFFIKCNIRKYAGKTISGTIALA